MREQRNPELVPGWFLLLCLFLIWSGIAFGQTRQLSTGPINLTSLPTVSPDSQHAVYLDDAGLWSVPLHGGDPVPLLTLLPGRQLFGAAQITPDGLRVVFISDQDTVGKPELFSVPTTGGSPTRISKAMAADRQVRDFLISPTSQRVYYAADGDTNNVIELFRADIGGGPTTKLNRSIGVDYDIFEFLVSPQDRIVYRSGTSTVGKYKLYSVPGNGRSVDAREISRDMVTGGSAMEFALSADGQHTIYRGDALQNGRFDLFSVLTTGGASVRLDKDDGRSVRAAFTVDASGVTYSYTPTEWYRVPVAGGASVAVPAPVKPPVKSADGKWTAYPVGTELWSSGASFLPRRVSCAGQAVTTSFLLQPTFSVTPNSASVVFIANNEVFAGPISGAVCLLFSDGFENGTTNRW